MKCVAIATRNPDFAPDEFEPHLPDETRQAIQLYSEGKIREIYSRADGKGAVLIIEAEDEEEARNFTNTLPLVKLGMISFEIYGTAPYRGFLTGL